MSLDKWHNHSWIYLYISKILHIYLSKIYIYISKILKSRNITLPAKVCQSFGFSSGHVWMSKLNYKESWALKNWCFWPMVLKKTLESPNQSILNEINPEYSLEGLMLKLKLWYFGYLMWRTDSFEERVILGMIEGGRRRGQQRMRWLGGITNSMDGRPGVL